MTKNNAIQQPFKYTKLLIHTNHIVRCMPHQQLTALVAEHFQINPIKNCFSPLNTLQPYDFITLNAMLAGINFQHANSMSNNCWYLHSAAYCGTNQALQPYNYLWMAKKLATNAYWHIKINITQQAQIHPIMQSAHKCCNNIVEAKYEQRTKRRSNLLQYVFEPRLTKPNKCGANVAC